MMTLAYNAYGIMCDLAMMTQDQGESCRQSISIKDFQIDIIETRLAETR